MKPRLKQVDMFRSRSDSCGASRCGCGNEKKTGHIICGECWDASPVEERTAFNNGSHTDRLAIARRLIKFARERGARKALR